MTAVAIRFLAEVPGHADTLAGWHHAQWSHLYDDWTPEQTRSELRDHATRRTRPTTLVALQGEPGKADAMQVREAADWIVRPRLLTIPGVALTHPSQANMIFANWSQGGHARLQAAGAMYYDLRPLPDGRETARLVASWSTTEEDVDAFLAALRGH